MDRRDFLKKALQAGGVTIASPMISSFAAQPLNKTAAVAFVKTTDRAAGVNRAIDLLNISTLKGKDLFIKPNFNSSDEPPGSTHLDTLAAIVRKLQKLETGRLTIGDRSGMGDTRKVMDQLDAFRFAREMSCDALVFDELSEKQWDHIGSTHWSKGFFFPTPVRQAAGIVQTCNLKTHRFGGHFTLSLKNSVGLAAKFVPGDSYNYMKELHSSPHQRLMIAEINSAYQPDLIVLDGVEAFVTGGPESGKKVNSGVILAGTDRIAIDAVGVALLRHFGTTSEVSRGKIFEQDQIARAVQLNLGVGSPQQIELLTDDPESRKFAGTIQQILLS
jgi:uncharacterized protein (DUF362 family)